VNAYQAEDVALNRAMLLPESEEFIKRAPTLLLAGIYRYLIIQNMVIK
jgi:hypothetical protein